MAHAGGPLDLADSRPSGDRLFTPAFIALTVAELAYFTAAGMQIPLVPLFAEGPLDAGKAGAGVAFGAFSFTALILRPFAGRLADRRGRRPLLIGGGALFAAVMAGHLFVDSLPALIALRLVLGVAEALFFVAGFAMLADMAPPSRTGEALSFNSLSLYLGIAFGPVIGRVLLDSGGFAAGWIGAAGLGVVAAVIATRVHETLQPRRAGDPDPPLICRGAIAPALALFTGVAGAAGFFTFVALRAEELGTRDWNVVLLLYGLVVVGARVVFARLPDRVPPFRLTAGALALCSTGLLVATLVADFVGLVVGAAILALGVAFVTPAVFAAIFNRVAASERGSAAGTASLLIDLAFGGAPMVLGFVAAAAGIPAAFAVSAAVAAAGAIGSVLLATSRTRRAVPA